jgi:hypothetical protein
MKMKGVFFISLLLDKNQRNFVVKSLLHGDAQRRHGDARSELNISVCLCVSSVNLCVTQKK